MHKKKLNLAVKVLKYPSPNWVKHVLCGTYRIASMTKLSNSIIYDDDKWSISALSSIIDTCSHLAIGTQLWLVYLRTLILVLLDFSFSSYMWLVATILEITVPQTQWLRLFPVSSGRGIKEKLVKPTMYITYIYFYFKIKIWQPLKVGLYTKCLDKSVSAKLR